MSKVYHVWLGVAPTPHPNYKRLFQLVTKQIILYRSMECTLYHLVWVVGEWLVKKLKIVKKLSGLCAYNAVSFFFSLQRDLKITSCIRRSFLWRSPAKFGIAFFKDYLAPAALGAASSEGHQLHWAQLFFWRLPGTSYLGHDFISKPPATLGAKTTRHQLHWTQLPLKTTSCIGRSSLWRPPAALGAAFFEDNQAPAALGTTSHQNHQLHWT